MCLAALDGALCLFLPFLRALEEEGPQAHFSALWLARRDGCTVLLGFKGLICSAMEARALLDGGRGVSRHLGVAVAGNAISVIVFLA